MKKFILVAIVIAFGLPVSAQFYGPFYGANVFVNKSNLFNSDDYRADSFQTYKMTPSFAGNFEIGYLYQTGLSVATGIQFGTCNQKYTGSNNYYPYNLTATTKTSSIRIPVIFGIQKMNDKKLKFLYTVGFYYSYNTSYSDKWELTNKVPTNNVTQVQTYTLKDDIISYENNINKQANYSANLDKRPYQRQGLGALGSVGIKYQLKEKLEFIAQLKCEFTVTNAEITDEIRFIPINDPLSFPYSGHVFQNHAKFMDDKNSNWNRASTHPFNLGISVGVRYYLFDF
jgi:hypothetical protein